MIIRNLNLNPVSRIASYLWQCDTFRTSCKESKSQGIMKPLFAIISFVVLGNSMIFAEDSISPDGERRRVSSDHAPVLPIPNQRRFEYKVHVLEPTNSAQESELNGLGCEGWELVTLVAVVNHQEVRGGMTYTAYLKRILRKPTSWTVAAKLLGLEANSEAFRKVSAVYGSATPIQSGSRVRD
jgi:hypothetical protein